MRNVIKMKGISALLGIGIALVGATGSFAYTFNTSNSYGGANGLNVQFGNHPDNFYAGQIFDQIVNFTPLLGSFSSVNTPTLAITYSDVGTANELYAAYVSNTGGTPTVSPLNLLGYASLGTLPGYNDALKHTKTFDLTSFEPTAPATGLASWTLYVAFRESTTGNDSMTLWNIRTYGDYNEYVPPTAVGGGETVTPLAANPVPEPSTIALLGMGLAGVGLARWRRKKA